MDRIIDVSGGQGGKAFLILGNKKTALVDCGMAYCAAELIGNADKVLEGRKLDYILISHSHYDHIGAIPYLREYWPEVTVLGAEYAKRVLGKSGALRTIRVLGEEAAAFYAGCKLREYDEAMLRVDKVVRNGDMLDLGGFRIAVIETKGHTQCSLSFLLNDEVMFASESAGYMSKTKKICPAYIVSYAEAIRSIEICRAISPCYIISPHYGLVNEEDTAGYWQKCLLAARETYEFILSLSRRGCDEEAILAGYEIKFRDEESRREHPISAFRVNVRSMIRTVVKESAFLIDGSPFTQQG